MNIQDLCRCGQPFVRRSEGSTTTLEFYAAPAGHQHDDNCIIAQFICAAGHKTVFSLRRTCPIPGCEWRGKPTCFCHEGEKVDRWPKIVEPIPTKELS